MLRTASSKDADLAKEHLENLAQEPQKTEVTRLWCAMGRWWKEIEVLIVTGVTPVEARPTTSNTTNRLGGHQCSNHMTRNTLRSPGQW